MDGGKIWVDGRQNDILPNAAVGRDLVTESQPSQLPSRRKCYREIIAELKGGAENRVKKVARSLGYFVGQLIHVGRGGGTRS